MFRFIEMIAEERIREAQRQGQFDELPGRGRPLRLHDDSMVPQDLRMAYHILRNAGYLPRKLAERNEIQTALDLLEHARDEQERYRQIRKLNYLMSRLAANRGRGASLEQDDEYYKAIVERISLARRKDRD